MAAKHALWVGVALLTSGCLGQADAKKVDDATARFYQQVAARQYQVIYDQAAPELRDNISPDIFVGFMQRIDRRLGACQPPVKRMDFHTNATSQGFFQEQGYNQTCANGALQESVTMVLRGGEAKLAGYHASSPLLLTD
ncbi:MAG TPA: hypothetical protein VHZ26_04875 [Caulobacteraceae bacterium]|jgi:hypothetical protein|nr:hypothetical protein [Caulobacteraceae bacterium]